MSVHLPDAYLAAMYQAALKAEPALLRDFGEVDKLQISIKGPGDFVSRADRKAEQDIHHVLSHSFPEFGFLMEESGASGDQENCWVIDPLDGTTNFLHAIPHWAISIALKQGKTITRGLIHDPLLNETFYAVRQQGAFMNRTRIRCSSRNSLSRALVSGAWQRPSGVPGARERSLQRIAALQSKVAALRITGSAALNFAYVAAGRMEGYYQEGLEPWDCAAGVLLLQEAGGMISQPDGREFNSMQRQVPFIASNDNLHNSLLDCLAL